MKKIWVLTLLALLHSTWITPAGYVPAQGPLKLDDNRPVNPGAISTVFGKNAVIQRLSESLKEHRRNILRFTNCDQVKNFTNPQIDNTTLPDYQTTIQQIQQAASETRCQALKALDAYEIAVRHLLADEMYMCSRYSITPLNIGARWPYCWLKDSDTIKQLINELDQLADIAANHSWWKAKKMKAIVKIYRHWRKILIWTPLILGSAHQIYRWKNNGSDFINACNNGDGLSQILPSFVNSFIKEPAQISKRFWWDFVGASCANSLSYLCYSPNCFYPEKRSSVLGYFWRQCLAKKMNKYPDENFPEIQWKLNSLYNWFDPSLTSNEQNNLDSSKPPSNNDSQKTTPSLFSLPFSSKDSPDKKSNIISQITNGLYGNDDKHVFHGLAHGARGLYKGALYPIKCHIYTLINKPVKTPIKVTDLKEITILDILLGRCNNDDLHFVKAYAHLKRAYTQKRSLYNSNLNESSTS